MLLSQNHNRPRLQHRFGLEAARHFARLGVSRIIVAVRDVKKGEVARKSIQRTIQRRWRAADGATVVEVWQLELSSYASVKDFAARAEKELERLDVLCLNAGIATGTLRITEKDESTITTNLVSTFLLAFLLLTKLKSTAQQYHTQPVLTVVSSEAVRYFPPISPPLIISLRYPSPSNTQNSCIDEAQHAFATFPERSSPQIFATLSDPQKANMAERYFVSKLLAIFVVREMASRLTLSSPFTSPPKDIDRRELPITINTVNPGFCRSELAREAGWYLWLMGLLLARSSEVGSRTLIKGAEDENRSTHGKFMSECRVIEPSAFVRSEEGQRVQKRVWAELVEKLEKIVGGVTLNL
ncbi:MAG: hypothetical protein Q9182_004129 [Xanthomendoza sp. 2 TL-2023]